MALDDLLVMCTGEAMAFPTLEEYIQKKNAKQVLEILIVEIHK